MSERVQKHIDRLRAENAALLERLSLRDDLIDGLDRRIAATEKPDANKLAKIAWDCASDIEELLTQCKHVQTGRTPIPDLHSDYVPRLELQALAKLVEKFEGRYLVDEPVEDE